MPFPTSYEPLRQAVEHALTRDTGMPSALSGEWLLRTGLPAESRQTTGHTARGSGKRTVSVEVRPGAALDEYLLMSDRMRSDVLVTVTVRAVANPVHKAEVDRAKAWLGDYEIRARAALTYPGALQAAPDGTSTGLDGFSLREDGDRYRVTGPRQISGQHLLELAMTWRTSVELTRPT